MLSFHFTQIYSVSFKFKVSGLLDLSHFAQECKIYAFTEPWHIEFVTYRVLYLLHWHISLCENLSETVLKAQLEIFLRQIKYIQVDIYDNS